MKNGAAGGYFGDSTLGGKLMTWDGRQYYLFYSGMNVSNQANFYMQLCLPPEMEVGESINVRNNGLIGIEDGGTVTIGGTTLIVSSLVRNFGDDFHRNLHLVHATFCCRDRSAASASTEI